MEIATMDVGTTYMEVKPDRRLFAKLDQRLSQEFGMDNNGIIELMVNWYGTKKAGKIWNDHLNQWLADIGYVRCSTDRCVYTKDESDDLRVTIVVYVDDLLVVAPDRKFIEEFAELGRKKFTKLKVEMSTSRFLGMTITRDRLKK